jgi:5-methylcytosine-specific restriction endonuclease McrA
MSFEHALDAAQGPLKLAREMLAARFGARPNNKEGDKYARFYRSRAWRAARFRYIAGLKPEQRRCMACGATAREVRLAVDHVVPIKTEEGWARRLDQTNYQILCATDCNLMKGSRTVDFRTAEPPP